LKEVRGFAERSDWEKTTSQKKVLPGGETDGGRKYEEAQTPSRLGKGGGSRCWRRPDLG